MRSIAPRSRDVSLADGERLARILLCALAFAAGVTDAVTYLTLGHVFTANMTGNTVLMGVALVAGEGARVAMSGCALGGFCAGVAAAAGLAGLRSQRELWPARVTWVLGVEGAALGALGLLAIPAGISPYLLVVISGVAMGIQSAAVHEVGVPGVATTYLTGTLTGMIVGVVGGRRAGRPQRAGSHTPRTAVAIWTVYLAAAVCGAAVREAWGLGAMWIAAAAVALVVAVALARHRALAEQANAARSRGSG